MNNKNLIWFIPVTLLLIGGLFFFQSQKTSQEQKDTVIPQAPIVSGTGAFDAEGNPIPVNSLPVENETKLPPAPDMSGEIIFPKGYNSENKISVIEKIESFRKMTKDNPANVEAWIELGSYFKLIEDYKRAESAWIYAADIDKTNPIPLANLGFLYGYYIHNNTIAEKYYLEAINRAPNDGYLYFQAAEFYRVAMKDVAKAKAIVDKGILLNPKDSELKTLRESLNKF